MRASPVCKKGMKMFVEINPAYLLLALFFLTGGCYIFLSILTLVVNSESKIRRDYMAGGICLAIFSFFYGLMTIADNEALRRVFWAVGFTSGFMFFPIWLWFLLNVITFKNRYIKKLIIASMFSTAIVSLLCVFYGDADLVMTRYGTQFSYQNSAIFIVGFVFALILAIPLVIFQFKWWHDAELKRYRKLASVFISIAVMATSIGFITDFIVPVFSSRTIVPLGPVSILSASILTYARMMSSKTLRITVQNVSGYTFSSVEIPILVLDAHNNIGLENKAATRFFGCDVSGRNIADTVLVDGKPPEQSSFENSFASEIVTVKTPLGERTCDMLLTVEKDKMGDTICKVAIIRDITESKYKDRLLEAVNRVSGTLLEPDINNFENNLHTAMGVMAKAVDADRVFIWKNHTIDEDLCCTQVYQWFKAEEPRADDDYTASISYSYIMIGLEEHLANGHCINGTVSAMLPEHRAHLSAQGVLSIIMVPVFMHDHFWGFVEFDDCSRERMFSENEELILRSASRMIANSIIRNDMTKQLESALTDELTGARNRRYFMDAAEKELQKCIQAELPYSLIIIDADHFKEINDTYGHPAGDEVLRILVARIRHTLKLDTLVTRYGGDEFVVSLPEISEENALITAERIRYNIEVNAFKIDRLNLKVTISLGVASLSPGATTLAETIGNADKALYRAKQNGRNIVVNFDRFAC